MPDMHAKLSASSAKRWMACPKSVALAAKFPNDESAFAKEGTLAHKLAEITINYNLKKLTKAEFNKKWSTLKKDALYSKEMQEYVDGYVQFVWETINEAKAKCEDVLVFTEQRVDFSEYVPGGYGTGDVVIIADYLLTVIDLKYGKGVGVVAYNNPQIRLYELGSLNEFGMLYDINYVRGIIVQPRLDNITYEELSKEELRKWGDEVVRPAARLAANDEGSFCCGDHCRFCPARRTCRARAEANLDLCKFDFTPPELLDNSEIGEILRKIDQLTKWADDIKEYSLEEAKNGVKFDGWKLVEGRSSRKYVSDKEVKDRLISEGYEEAIITETKLLGITAMEKALGKKAVADKLKDLIIKPAGAPTLVEESDKREELKLTAKDDFSEETGLQTGKSDFDRLMDEEAKTSPWKH